MPPAKKKTKPKTRKAPIKHRKGPLSVIMPWLKRFGRGLAAITLIIWLGAWLVITGTVNRAMDWTYHQFLTQTAQAGLQVQNLLVEGRTYTDPALMKALLNIETGDPILGIKPREAQKLLEDTKWIERAHIQRRLPDTLYIQLTERTPMAIYKDRDGVKYLLDARGMIIDGEDTEKFSNLTEVSGANADTAAPALMQLVLQAPEIASRIVSAQRKGNRRWDIKIKANDNIITLKMPEHENMPLAFSRISQAQIDNQIFYSAAIDSIDLRFEDKIVIKTKPGKVIDYSTMQKKKEQGT